MKTRFVWVDFHRQMTEHKNDEKGRCLLPRQLWENMSYFAADLPEDKNAPLKASRLQDTLVRTNCVDCLDRTNVAQVFILNVICCDTVGSCCYYPQAFLAERMLSRQVEDFMATTTADHDISGDEKLNLQVSGSAHHLRSPKSDFFELFFCTGFAPRSAHYVD
jgi:hypothetical protein